MEPYILNDYMTDVFCCCDSFIFIVRDLMKCSYFLCNLPDILIPSRKIERVAFPSKNPNVHIVAMQLLLTELFSIYVICCYSLQYVEENSYGYNGNEEIKLAAATVYVSTSLSYPNKSNAILSEIVHQTYLNESLLRKLGQSIQEFYFDHKES